MYATPENFAAASKAGFDNLISVASTGLAGFEKLVALNVSSAKALLDDVAAGARASLELKDPKDLFTAGAGAAQPSLEKSLAWSKEAYAIVSETQAALRASLESHAAGVQKEFASALDRALKSAPPGTESAVAALRSAVAAATSAYDNATKAVRQAFDAAEANFTSAAGAAVANVTAATKAASKRR